MRNATALARIAVLGAVTLSAGVFAGCNGGGEPSDPHAKVEAVREALEAPTGTVDASTVAELNGFSATVQKLTSIVNLANAATPGAACYSGSQTDGTIDVECATKDLPEEQRLTGSVSLEAEVSGGLTSADVFAAVTYDNVCDAERCVSGVVSSETTVDSGGTSSTIAVSLDVTEGGKTTHIFWGTDLSISEEQVSAKIAIWSSLDQSFVLSTSVTAEGTKLTIDGANGNFECSVTPEGGSCSGSASFSF